MNRRRSHQDFSRELRSHLAIEADRLRQDGLSETEAVRRAHLNLGNLMLQEERFYEASPWAWFDQLRQDVRYSLRQLRNAPAFALTAALTLAVGIGGTTAIFTLIHAVLLKNLPVERPGELYTVGDAKRAGAYSGMAADWDIFSYDLYQYLRDHTDGLQMLAAFQSRPQRVGVRRNGDPRSAQPFTAEFASGNYFSTFGVSAFVGRVINDHDDRAGAPAIAVLAYRTWREKYGLDPSIIGASFLINSAPVTIVGVAAPWFFGDSVRANPPDFWLPLADEPAVAGNAWISNPHLHWLHLMGRVRPGVNLRNMEEQMRIELRQWLSHWPSLDGAEVARIAKQTLHLRPGGSGTGNMRGAYSSALELLLGISGFVLLIVCANLANLLLVRGLARRRQTSISLALGAARWRIVRQALTESLVLGLIGGAVGVGIAFAATKALLGAVFANADAVPIEPAPDLAVLAFAFALSLLTGLIFGVAPAWTANRADPMEALRGSRGATESTSLMQPSLVVLQAALSLMLIAAAGLLTQSLRNLEHQNFGFAADRRVALRVDAKLAGYKPDQLEELYRNMRDRLGRLAGVRNVSYALYAPMSGSNWTTDVTIDGQAPPAFDGQNLTSWNRVGPDYFETVGTKILHGRGILESDTATSRHVAVINEAFARRFFPNEDPLGKHFGALPNFARAFEIVGVAADAKYLQPDRPASPMYFVARPQTTPYDDPGTREFESNSLYIQDLILRLTPGTGVPENALRRTLAEIDPNLTVIRIQTFDVATSAQLSQEALIVRLTSWFGLTALLLASIGLYGVTSYSVARRSKEIGIRVALGADRQSVVAMVLRNAYSLVGIGLALGIPLALAMARFMGSKLYGISWYNPSILFGAATVLAAGALIATIVPARRAAALDPVETLRQD